MILAIDCVFIAAVLVWAIGWLPVARSIYRNNRPYTEPLSCPYGAPHPQLHTHDYRCYMRTGAPAETQREALRGAAGLATLWPLFVAGEAAFWLARTIARPVGRAIVAGDREDPAELRATIARLERELSQQQPQP